MALLGRLFGAVFGQKNQPRRPPEAIDAAIPTYFDVIYPILQEDRIKSDILGPRTAIFHPFVAFFAVFFVLFCVSRGQNDAETIFDAASEARFRMRSFCACFLVCFACAKALECMRYGRFP